MANKYSGDPVKVQESANNTFKAHEELENDLGALFNVSDELAKALASKGAGDATQIAMSDALHKGKSLDGLLVQIVEQMKKAGVTVDETDNWAKSKISAVAGNSKISAF
ncbi:hypothetical protein [Nocardia acidivorans]|uniref:hypothetical protein n=1 Tax=Nocardia acidivorans TaxID=404580 RepID=UPI00082C0271|nr:hypothetical protein [Nocardia acidivorans]